MGLKEDLLRAAAYIGATNDSPDDEATISAAEGDRIAGVLRELAERAADVQGSPAPDVLAIIEARMQEHERQANDPANPGAMRRRAQGRYGEAKAIYQAIQAAPGVQPSAEPIPEKVYWAPLADNFYSAEGGGMGVDFYQKWKPRRAEFPQGEAFGFGKGSAHNPFKDAPRTAGVALPRADQPKGGA